MKSIPTFLFAASLAFGIAAYAQDTDLPSEAAAARARYEADAAAAVKPIQQRYIVQLDGFKKNATSHGDLNTALVIDQEIKRFTTSAQTDNVSDVLCGSLWTNHGDTWEFVPDGTLIQKSGGWAGKSWKVSENNKSVELTFANGQKHLYAFKGGQLIHFDKSWGAFRKRPK